MKILLVNGNPVVSRLTALSARKESIKLDEIKDISELKNSDYDVVFVDFESYSRELSNVLNNSNISKRVLFYTQEDRDKPEIFNLSILKPFLPSEVSAVLREMKIEMEEREQELAEKPLRLSDLIAEKKDDLVPIKLEKDEVSKKEEDKNLELVRPAKEIIREEKIEKDSKSAEEELLAELNQSKDKIKNIEESPALNIIEEVLPEDIKNDSKLFEVEFKEDKKVDNNSIELFEIDSTESKESDTKELFEIDNSDSDSKNEILNFDADSKDEVDFDKSTKILNGDEISNIKSLLDDNIERDEEMTLEDVMTTTPPSIPEKIEKKSKKRKRSKVKKHKEVEAGSKVILNSLGSLPVDDLRRLLLGAEVHITIKFPKE
jgi:hypothetical protein